MYGRERGCVFNQAGLLGRICGLRFINIVLRRAVTNVFSVRRYIMSAGAGEKVDYYFVNVCFVVQHIPRCTCGHE